MIQGVVQGKLSPLSLNMTLHIVYFKNKIHRTTLVKNAACSLLFDKTLNSPCRITIRYISWDSTFDIVARPFNVN